VRQASRSPDVRRCRQLWDDEKRSLPDSGAAAAGAGLGELDAIMKKKTNRTVSKGTNDAALRAHLVALLKGRGAHMDFGGTIAGFPVAARGRNADGLPHTPWQLLEHLRIAQWDILEFSRDAKHVSPEWPEGYWPKAPAPADEAAWENSVASFERDLREMIKLVKNPKTDLYAKIPHGEGQTILREALVLADHNSYHLGQMVDLRRALGVWEKS
jgi:DinB family protein